MRQVKLQKMHIENFKGLRLFDIAFDESVTRIIGANGTGKTTLHDAYLWALTGMDSQESAAFKVQPMDESSSTISHLVTSVSCTLSFDGVAHTFTRRFKQKWTRPRGTKEDVLSGNTSEFFIDDEPMTLTEYSSKVSSLFCRMDDFKLISSIYAFGRLDTKSKREMLIRMAGQLPEIMSESAYPRLSAKLEPNKCVDAIKKTALFEIGKLKDEKSKIPTKIAENERDLPEGVDFNALKDELAAKKSQLASIDERLQKKSDGRSSAYAKVAKLRADLTEAETMLAEIIGSIRYERGKKVSELESQASTAKTSVAECESLVRIIENELLRLSEEKSQASAKLQKYIEQWKIENAKTFTDTTGSECPTCHHIFTESERTEMRNALIVAFNSGKSSLLKAIQESGQAARDELNRVTAQIESKTAEVAKLKEQLADARKRHNECLSKIAEIPSAEQLASVNKEYQTILDKQASIKQSIADATPKEDEQDASLNEQKRALSCEIESIIRKLSLEENIEKVSRRRAELEKEDEDLSSKIAELEGLLYEIHQYQKARIELVENTVSSRFKFVRWKMYESNLTNDGEKEICECLVDGIPVSTNVNTAGSVNAGIDIINALSEWIGVSVPLWIDGKESVCNLLQTDAQIITLEVVDKSELKVA